ncbi:MAG: hypothetical protein HC774_08185 [Sphingomonadales bacterium]|nr:hypothetical protein [Sphingomonadales bacterium]
MANEGQPGVGTERGAHEARRYDAAVIRDEAGTVLGHFRLWRGRDWLRMGGERRHADPANAHKMDFLYRIEFHS